MAGLLTKSAINEVLLDTLSQGFSFATDATSAKALSWTATLLLMTLSSIYLFYYFHHVVTPPKVVTSNDKMERFLRAHCPVLWQDYWPTFWALQTHMQTIGRVVVQKWHTLSMTRETLKLSDGGIISLDWYNEKDSVSDEESDRPTVILLPGVSGSSEENYISHFMLDLKENGYRSVVSNYRGCGSTPLATPMLNCAGNIEDLRETIDYIKKRFPNSPLMAVGTSLGGVQIVCYLNECYKLLQEPKIIAALVISVPWNLHVTAEQLHRPLNRYTINAFLSSQIKAILTRNKEVFLNHQEISINFHTVVNKCYCFQDLEQHLSCPMFGFKNCLALREHASPHNKIHGIRVPLLCLNSTDDPFCPQSAIPEGEFLKNPHIAAALTSYGGHVGFMQGLFPIGKTLMDIVLIQFTDAVFSHKNALKQIVS